MKFYLMALAMLTMVTTASAAPLVGNAVKVLESGSAQKIDCKGQDLTVVGDHDTLTITGCRTINVVGNYNKMTAQLLPESTIAALGDSNHIVFIHSPGVEVQVTSTGSNNEIVPQMDRDPNQK